MHYRFLTLTLVLSLAASAAPGDGEVAKLQPADLNAGEIFGISVDVDGDLAVVGNTLGDGTGVDTGTAYVFDAATGQELFKLTTGEPASFDAFGGTVALEGTTAVIGATLDNVAGTDDAGSLFVFDASNGQKLGKLVASDGANGDRLGGAIAIQGGVVVAGAVGDFGYTGSAYAFDLASGQELMKFQASDGDFFEEFGTAVALDGSLVLVGSKRFSPAGSAYLFDLTTGQELRIFTANDPQPNAGFGNEVELARGLALIGAPGADTNAGAVYVFDVATGAQLAKITPPTPKFGGRFGSAIDVEGTTLVVGSPRTGNLAGVVDLFEVGTWLPTGTVEPNGGTSSGERFGWSVATSDARILVGDPAADGASGGGAAYLFVRPEEVGTNYCGPAVPNSTGASGVIAAKGSARVDDACLELRATKLPPNKFGYFLTSATQAYVPNPGGSQGDLCLGGVIGRYVKLIENSGTAGEFSIQVDLTKLPAPIGVPVFPGDTYNFTTWYRDVNPTNTSNFTDAVSVTFS